MDFLFIPNSQQIPEWKQCYYDNKTIVFLYEFIIKSNQLSKQINSLNINCQIECQRKFYSRSIDRINQIMQISRSNFYQYIMQQQQIVANFIQYKIFQISNKFNIYQAFMIAIGQRSYNMVLLLQNLFIQAFYLQSANISNSNYENDIISKLKMQLQKKNCQRDLQYTKSSRLTRMSKQTFKLRNEIELVYDVYSQKFHHMLSFQKIRKLYKKNDRKKFSFYYIGGFMGAMICFILILFVINDISRINLSSNEVFATHFPAWRGALELVFYIWVLGLCVLFYQRTHINYRLVFHSGKTNFPQSNFLFSVASISTFILLFLMLLFILKIKGTIKTQFVNFAQLFWLGFLIYILEPFRIFNYKGRMHWLKMTCKTLFFCFFPMNFLTIWIAQQMVSLTQPASDFFYMIFNLFAKSRTVSAAVAANFNSAIVIGVFVSRLFQNIKMWLQLCNKTSPPIYNFWHPPFLGAIRAFFGILAAIAGLFNRLKLFPGAFALWIVMIILATLVAWYVDVRGDWGLLQHQSSKFLRQKLLFPNLRFFYVFILFFNLILRVAWVLTISPFYINGTLAETLLFVMMISFIQIFRRGVWNILRIQNQHVKNCAQFQATVRDDQILSVLKQQIKQKIKKRCQKRSSDLSTSHIITQKQLKQCSSRDFSNSINFLKRVVLQTQEKHKSQQVISQRIKFQLQIFRDSLKNRVRLRKTIIQLQQQLEKQIKMIKKKLTLGGISKKFIAQQ